jgi:protocatechuate 3,4-dioxygenase beta subunit
MASKGIVTIVVIFAIGASAFAQMPGGPVPPPQGAAGRGQRPVRAQPQRADAPRGTSVLRGQIVAADNGSPIRRAQVRVSSPDARESRIATTDQQGRFEIKELPAGRYTITASKGGFVTLQYGQRRPSESGTPLELGDAQMLDKIAIALPRGSVLGGRITDEFGEPVANASVSAWRYAYVGGTRRMVAAGQNSRDTTDDQGQFRLFGLPPGDYFVSATLRSGGPDVTDPMGEPSGYAATYYPGTTNVAEAAKITLAVSQENTSVSFGLIATRMVQVSGQVITSSGAPATGGMVRLIPTGTGGRPAIAAQSGGAGNRIDQNGTFRISSVAAGRYVVQARSGGREFELARMDLVVGAENVDGVTLVTAPGATLSGQVVSDTGEPFDFTPSQLQIGARPGSPDAMAVPGGGGSRVGNDWSFALPNITDVVLIRATAPQGWTTKAVYVNGQDITDTPVEFPAGQTVSGAQIVLTKKVTALTGQVTDGKGNPVVDATVVVFPADERLWTFQSRFIKAARPDQDGKYRVSGLPGSENYLVVALQGLEDGQAGDPEFLATVKALGSKLALGDGESKALDVTLTGQK